MRIHELNTPALVADADVLERNLRTMSAALPGARLRPHQLVVVGPARAPLPNHGREVVVRGYLNDPELVSLYRRASMVVQPSLYEGFGLPVLEAMACGTPVACADIRAFREVAGECAVYFDPRNAVAIADAMEELAGDPALCEDQVRGGRVRARRFSWEAGARALLEVFGEAVS
ncbi:MAG: glycosyltransferase [Planctomycetota bacterium]